MGSSIVDRIASTNPLVKIAWAMCSISRASCTGTPVGRLTLLPPWPAPMPMPLWAVALNPAMRWSLALGGRFVVRVLAWLVSEPASLF